jgi:predicted aspartyl protease
MVAVSALTLATLPACTEAPSDRRDEPPSADSSAGSETDVARVSYRTARNQRLIDVHIMGQGPFTFLVDTGVTGAAIDSSLAARLGIELPVGTGQTMEGGAAAGRVIVQTWIPDLSVGSIRLDSLQAAALPLDALSERLGEELGGILGDGFLKTRVTRFDDVGRTLSFASSLDAFADDVATADYVTPLEFRGGDMPILEVTLAGASFIATLDMGSSLGLEIFTPFAEEFGLGHAFEEWEEGTVMGGSLGQATVYDGTVDRIDIGPLTLTDVPTCITPPRSDSDREGNRKGNLGNQLWEGYVLILDYVGGQVVFVRR